MILKNKAVFSRHFEVLIRLLLLFFMHEGCIVFYVEATLFDSCGNSNYRCHIKHKSGFMIHALIISHLRFLFTYLLMI